MLSPSISLRGSLAQPPVDTAENTALAPRKKTAPTPLPSTVKLPNNSSFFGGAVGRMVGRAGSGSLEQRTANLLTQKDAQYRDIYVPQERELAGTLDDDSLVNEAKTNANRDFNLRTSVQDRNFRRYGIEPDALQKQFLTQQHATGQALNYDAAVNNARVAQDERNISLRNALINVGRDIETTATGSLSRAASAENDRKNAYESAKAGYKAQQISTAASLGALAFFL